MSDLVVTVPMNFWADWLAEGDLPGEPPGGAFDRYDFTCASSWRPRPPIAPGERVYIVAHGRLRGYAPLVEVTAVEGRWSLVRAGGAVACTIPEPIKGFRGYLKRWWDRAAEVPFPDWKVEGVVDECRYCCRRTRAAIWSPKVRLFVCADCVRRNIEARRTKGTPYPPGDEAELLAAAARAEAVAALSSSAASAGTREYPSGYACASYEKNLGRRPIQMDSPSGSRPEPSSRRGGPRR